MYEIRIKVNANGTLECGTDKRLRLGTTGEYQRIKMIFDVDEAIDSTYHYIKFSHKKASYLYRVNNNEYIVNRNIQAFDGVWLFSFIATNAVITNNKITGTYAFISEPTEAVVVKGILDKEMPTEEEIVLKGLCEMSFKTLSIPDTVTSIGDYFLYNSKKAFNLEIGTGVTSIGTFAFYDGVVNQVTFKKESSLTTMKENSFYHMTFACEIVFPKSITTWNKGVLQSSSVRKVSFESGSQLKTLVAYSFRDVNTPEIVLPDGLTSILSNTFKSCLTLTKLWIPKSINTTIPHTAISGCTSLTTIELESEFNADAYFDNCDLNADAMVNMFYALKNRRTTTSGKLILGLSNLAKLTETQKLIAVNKNWTLS